MLNESIFTESTKRIENLPIWSGELELAPISGGRTNYNFLAKDESGVYFARYGVDLPHHFIFRKNEKNAITLASDSGVGPKLLLAQNNCLITDFISGKCLEIEKEVDDERLIAIANVLKKMHNTEIKYVTNEFDVAKVIRSYIEQLGGKLEQDIHTKVIDILDNAPQLQASHFVHGDLIPNNFINDGKRLWLIDWEYAGLGHPSVDLAMVISNFELTEAQSRILIKSHGLCEFSEVMKVNALLIAREAMWTLVQIDNVGLIGDLEEYLNICLNRLQECS